MTTVFLDTVGLIAIWDDTDQWHALAKQAYALLRKERRALVTTRHVLLECGNAASRTPFREDVCELRDSFESHGRLIAPTEDDWTIAWEAYRRGEASNAGIVDQVSFIVMRRLGIRQVFTNDQHFRAAGFETLF